MVVQTFWVVTVTIFQFICFCKKGFMNIFLTFIFIVIIYQKIKVTYYYYDFTCYIIKDLKNYSSTDKIHN